MKYSFKFMSGAMALLLMNACTLPGMALKTDSDNGTGFYRGLNSDAAEVENGSQPAVVDINAELLAQQYAYQTAALNDTSVGITSRRESLKREIDDYIYKVGPNDVLTIIVWDHPELTSPVGEFRSEESSGREVRSDGSIFFPFVGNLPVEGKTVSQIRSLLARKLRPFIKEPQVDVRVAAYRSKKIYLTGEVVEPGVVYLTQEPPTLFEVLNRAGGLKPTADQRLVRLSRGGRSYVLDMARLYQYGDPIANVMVKPGDIITVPDNRATRVFVLGEVNEEQALPMLGGRMSLADALLDTGSIDKDTADAARIYVIRGVLNKPESDGSATPVDPSQAAASNVVVFRLDASSPDALVLADQFDLAPRDVVFVSSTRLTQWNRVLAQILPSISALFQTSAFVRAFQ